ncbi:efflux RND transporter periplasmic adaptor subunit [Sphingomonas sp.]|uniref:efflux RND transporter periplasmic adaptor subunit n=1 Tax=Sphingomonas sp. TaxID=28214 RepID=UPI0025F2CCD0|nr:efflux RND transporter periplasmic adaptor subunit [Sphingomonas sp.]MBV9527248.1 efflux RND transporter periplasmic adaptor subunit [Sphingomonas sp.]
MRDAMAAGERAGDFPEDIVARRASAEQPRSSRSVRKRRRFSPWLLLILALAIAGGVYWVRFRPAPPPSGPAAPVAVPVTAEAAKSQDVPVRLAAIGSIQAANTVVVRSRVDGELQKVAFHEGQMVKEGDLLAQIDPRPFQAALDQAVAKKQQDTAQRANAQRDLVRYNQLGAYATGQQRDTQVALVDQLTAQIAGDEAAIENAQTQLSYTRITAPLSGRTGFRLVDQGNIVHASDQNGLVTIAQLQPIAGIFTLPERYLGQIQNAMKAGPVKVWALQQDAKTEVAQGTLALIDNSVDPTTGTIRGKAIFPNEDNKLWPGEFVNVRVQTGITKDATTIPATAVLHGQDDLYAYVVKPDNKVESRPLKTGYSTEEFYVVTDGIKPGETVVTGGQYRLTNGTLVAINKGDDGGQPPEQQATK